MSPVEINIDKWEEEIQDSLIWENNLDVINSTSEPKKKPNPKAWLEKYGKHLHPKVTVKSIHFDNTINNLNLTPALV